MFISAVKRNVLTNVGVPVAQTGGEVPFDFEPAESDSRYLPKRKFPDVARHETSMHEVDSRRRPRRGMIFVETGGSSGAWRDFARLVK